MIYCNFSLVYSHFLRFADNFNFRRFVPTSAKRLTNYWHVRRHFILRPTTEFRQITGAIITLTLCIKRYDYSLRKPFDQTTSIFIIGNEFRSLVLQMKGPLSGRFLLHYIYYFAVF